VIRRAYPGVSSVLIIALFGRVSMFFSLLFVSDCLHDLLEFKALFGVCIRNIQMSRINSIPLFKAP
jgi:hypothetical protein